MRYGEIVCVCVCVCHTHTLSLSLSLSLPLSLSLSLSSFLLQLLRTLSQCTDSHTLAHTHTQHHSSVLLLECVLLGLEHVVEVCEGSATGEGNNTFLCKSYFPL